MINPTTPPLNPALTVILVAAGAMERDGVFFLAGCLLFALTASYFGLLAMGGAHVLDELRQALFQAWP